MTERSFFDTNVLVYADDRADPARQARARQLIRDGIASGKMVVSTQVLQEYFVTAYKKLNIDPTVARRKVELYATQQLMLTDTQLILEAIDLHRLHQLSFWDSLIVCAASQARCKVLYSEDMQAGFQLRGLRIKNPFHEPKDLSS